MAVLFNIPKVGPQHDQSSITLLSEGKLILYILYILKVHPFSLLDLFELQKYADVHWSAEPCPIMLFSVLFSYQIDHFIFLFIKLFQITNSQRVSNFIQCNREPFKNYLADFFPLVEKIH